MVGTVDQREDDKKQAAVQRGDYNKLHWKFNKALNKCIQGKHHVSFEQQKEAAEL